jgi:GxxExxY protein
MKTAEQLNALGGSIIGAAIEVHKVLGPGLLESIYQEALQIELKNRGHDVHAEVPISLTYREQDIGKQLRINLIVDAPVIVEVKAVSNLTGLAQAQLLTYLKLAKLPLGYIINFHEPTLLKGLRRLVNDFPKAA